MLVIPILKGIALAIVLAKLLVLIKYSTLTDLYTRTQRAQNERVLELQEENARLQQALQRADHSSQKVEAAHQSRLESVRAECERRVQEAAEAKALLEEQLRRAAISSKEMSVKHEHEVGVLWLAA